MDALTNALLPGYYEGVLSYKGENAMISSTSATRETTIQRLHVSYEHQAQLSKLLIGQRLSGNTGPMDFPNKFPTFPTPANDSIHVSAEAMKMYHAREIPLITEREITVFSRNILEEHMEDAHRHLALMKRAILDPGHFSNTNLTLEERTLMREGILLEAQRLAETYLNGEEAQRFVEGFENLIHKAEMMERGYVRDSWHGTLSMMMLDGTPFRSPFSRPDAHALNRFVEGNMTEAQQTDFDALSNEVNRLSDLIQYIATGGDYELSLQSILDAFDEATAALRTFVNEMGAYHDFQEQWDLWQSGESNNSWFAAASTAFEENSRNIATQIEAIQADIRNQFNLNGTDIFISLLAQINNNENPFSLWLAQLPAWSRE